MLIYDHVDMEFYLFPKVKLPPRELDKLLLLLFILELLPRLDLLPIPILLFEGEFLSSIRSSVSIYRSRATI